MSTKFSGAAGEFFVAGELSRLGKIALPTTRNTKGFDIIATNSDFSKTNYIQVKTNGIKYDFWIVGKPFQPASDRYYVFVNLIDSNTRPEYYVVPSKEVYEKYNLYINVKSYEELDDNDLDDIVELINNNMTGWKIVSKLGIHIKAIRKVAKERNLHIHYDRGEKAGGEDFPFSFTIKKDEEIQYRDRWDLLTI